MTEIHYGLKLWSHNTNLIDDATYLIRTDTFQFIELTIIPDTDISPFLDREIPFMIHLTPDHYGVNIADCRIREFNHRIIHQCREWADQLNARYIILHPGFGRLECAIHLLGEYNDPRIIIENMPKQDISGERLVGYSPDQMKDLCQGKFGSCLDLNHAIKAAITLKKDFHEFIEEFLHLEPAMFHISDGSFHHQVDEHLNFGEGDYPLPFLMSCLKGQKIRYVTLETPRHSHSLHDDVKNLKVLQGM